MRNRMEKFSRNTENCRDSLASQRRLSTASRQRTAGASAKNRTDIPAIINAEYCNADESILRSRRQAEIVSEARGVQEAFVPAPMLLIKTQVFMTTILEFHWLPSHPTPIIAVTQAWHPALPPLLLPRRIPVLPRLVRGSGEQCLPSRVQPTRVESFHHENVWPLLSQQTAGNLRRSRGRLT